MIGEREASSEPEIIQEPGIEDIDPNFFNYEFSLNLGNKELRLSIWVNHGYAMTRIRNLWEEPIPHTTTRLYQRVAEILCQVTDLRRKAIRYEFMTEKERMKKWASDYENGGGAIFAWDSLKEDGTGHLKGKKTFGKQYRFPRSLLHILPRV